MPLAYLPCDASGGCSVAGLDDGNVCTLDTCDASGVSHTVTPGASCSDGDACNGAETCGPGGSCLAGCAPALDDGDPCTADTCDPDFGAVHTPVAIGSPCEDGDACNGVERCDAAGVCIAGTAPTVDDNNPCTVDACDSNLGITHQPVAVDDGDGCTRDACVPGLGVTHTVTPWAPSGTIADACSGGDTCDATGECLPAPAPGVEDGDDSTIDYCDPATGVHHVAAPTLDPTATTTVFDALAFLYTGADPVQFGVTPGSLSLERGAGVHGHVSLASGAPAELAQVRVLGQPELGVAIVDAHGDFMMAVNGGGPLTLDIQRDGYLSAQRTAAPGWNEYASIEDTILVATIRRPRGSTSAPRRTPRSRSGSVESDNIGSRQATLLVPPGTTAIVEMPDGSTTPLAAGTVRATEYTVGADGPRKMPAALPRSSGYTYAVDLTIDEADAAGATGVRFDRPVILYVDNFYQFAVGTVIPHGSYDRVRGVWDAERDGVVVRIVGATAGRADVDADGDGAADAETDLDALGITTEERESLAAAYPVNATLWRVPVLHFSPHDLNQPSYPEEPNCEPGQCDNERDEPDLDEPLDKGCEDSGSRIECQNGVVGETIPLPGTSMSLRYTTARTPGYVAARKLSVPFSESVVPSAMRKISVTVEIAGRVFASEQECPCAPDQRFEITWDGKDRYGRPVEGEQPAGITWSYFYKRIMGSSSSGKGYSFGQGSGGVSAVFINAGTPTTPNGLWDFQLSRRVWLGTQDARRFGLGGWELSPVNSYEPLSRTLVRGDGSRKSDASLRTAAPGAHAIRRAVSLPGGGAPVFTTLPNGAIVAQSNGSIILPIFRREPDGSTTQLSQQDSNCSFTLDDGPALDACLSAPSMAASPDGKTIFFADSVNGAIRRIDPDGIVRSVTQFDPTHSLPSEGCPDGALAKDTILSGDDLHVADDGSLYFSTLFGAFPFQIEVCRIGPEGRLSVVAGGGATGWTDQNLTPAWQRRFVSIAGIAIDHGGSLYVAEDTFNRVLIWRVTPDGLAELVAGAGADDHLDDVDALSTLIVNLRAMAVGGDGTLYFTSTGRGLDDAVAVPGLRALRPNGRIYTLAGHSQGGAASDQLAPSGSVAETAALPNPLGLAVGADGLVYVGSFDVGEPTILSIGPAHPALTGDDILVPEEDGRAGYVFDPRGRLIRTVDTVTGTALLQVGYGTQSRIDTLTDRDGRVTTIERDGFGRATAVVGPYGHRTELALDANGYLGSVTQPTGAAWHMTYDHGLITSFTNPNGHSSTLTYDPNGRLSSDSDPGGGSKSFVRTNLEDGWLVTESTAMGRTTLFQTTRSPDGTERLQITHPNGLVSTSTTDATTAVFGEMPNGVTTSWQASADPRFGLLSPLGAMSKTQPSGLTRSVSESRSVSLSDANDPLSVLSETTTITVNGRVGTIVYDADNDVEQITSPAGRTMTRTYDAAGHLVQLDVPLLLPIVMTYDADGRMSTATQGTRQTSWTYGPDGMVATITNPIHEVTTLGRDANGRVTAITRPDLAPITVGYDAVGHTTQVTPPGKPVHAFTFDSRELVSEYDPPNAATGPTATTYTYNLDRQLSDHDQPGSRNVHVDYDTQGRSTGITFPTGAIATTYDSASRVSTVAGPTGEALTFHYDGSLVTGVDLAGPVAGAVGFTYDADFRIASDLVNGAAVAFSYDADSLLLSAGALSIARDPQNGRVTGTAIGTLTDTVGYSPYGELSAYSAQQGSTSLLSFTYTRDDLGRITQKTETVEGVARTFAYTYDNVGRLKTVTEDGGLVESYVYDLNGNRTSSLNSGGVFDGTFDGQDRMGTYGDAAFTYTANGELAYRIDPTTGTTAYTYDAIGNLRTVVLPTGTRVDYLVDPQGRRVGKKINGALTHGWLWRSALQPAAELDASGAVVARFVYAGGGNVPAYMVTQDGTYRILTDHLGSVRLVVDVASGVVAQRMADDSWGRVLEDTNPGFQPFGFAGGLYDADTGLVRFGARDYDAETGRWTARDPIGLRGGKDLFAYSDGDPINRRDSNGRGWMVALGGFVGGDALWFVAPPAAALFLGVGIWASVHKPTTYEDPADTGTAEPEPDLDPIAVAAAAAAATLEALVAEMRLRVEKCRGMTNFNDLEECCSNATGYEGGGEWLDYSPYRCTGEAGIDFTSKLARYAAYHECMGW